MHAQPEVGISLEVLHTTDFALCYFCLYVSVVLGQRILKSVSVEQVSSCDPGTQGISGSPFWLLFYPPFSFGTLTFEN